MAAVIYNSNICIYIKRLPKGKQKSIIRLSL